MKLQFEKIKPSDGNSFKMIHTDDVDPCWVFWHFHPEYEIVYIPRGNGRRHIGQHISRYEDGELVFIGPNIPHLNFGYGITKDYEEYVIQMKEEFMGKDFFNQVEMTEILRLFKLSHKVVLFDKNTKQEVGKLIEQMEQSNGFERLMLLFSVLQKLATTDNFTLLAVEGTRPEIHPKEQERFHRIYEYVEKNFRQDIDYQQVAELSGLTLAAFCRYFKKMTHLTFTDFINEFRINHARNLLMKGHSINTICYEVGFNNLSHFNRTFKKLTGKTPSEISKEMKVDF